MSKVIGRSLEYLKRIFQSPSSFAARQPRVLDPVLLTQDAMHGAYNVIDATGGAIGLKYITVQGGGSDERVAMWAEGDAFEIAPDHVRYVLCFSAWHDDIVGRSMFVHMTDIDENFQVPIVSRNFSRIGQLLHVPTGYPIPGKDTNAGTSSRGHTLVTTVAVELGSMSTVNMAGYFVDCWRGDLPPFGGIGGANTDS